MAKLLFGKNFMFSTLDALDSFLGVVIFAGVYDDVHDKYFFGPSHMIFT